MPDLEAASETTLDPLINRINGASSVEVAKILESTDMLAFNNPALLKEQTQTLIANGCLPELLSVLDSDGVGGVDTDALLWFGGDDKLIDFNNPEDVTRLRNIQRDGVVPFNGSDVELSDAQLTALSAIEQSGVTLDTMRGETDRKVGEQDYNYAMPGGEGEAQAENVLAREALIVGWSDPERFYDVFGDGADMDTVRKAYENPQDFGLDETEWRGLGYMLGNPELEVEREGSIAALSTGDLTKDMAKSFDYGDVLALNQNAGYSEAEIASAVESQKHLNEKTTDFERMKAKSHHDESEELYPEEEEVVTDEVEESSEENTESSDDDESDSATEIGRDEEGRVTSVFNESTGYGAEITYGESGELKRAKVTQEDGDVYDYIKMDDGSWMGETTANDGDQFTFPDEVDVDSETGKVTVTENDETRSFEPGADAVTEDEMEELESRLGRELTVRDDGSVEFTLQDGDTLFVIRNAVAGSIGVEEIAPGPAIYEDTLVEAIAADNAIANIDQIIPGQKLILSPKVLKKLYAA